MKNFGYNIGSYNVGKCNSLRKEVQENIAINKEKADKLLVDFPAPNRIHGTKGHWQGLIHEMDKQDSEVQVSSPLAAKELLSQVNEAFKEDSFKEKYKANTEESKKINRALINAWGIIQNDGHMKEGYYNADKNVLNLDNIKDVTGISFGEIGLVGVYPELLIGSGVSAISKELSAASKPIYEKAITKAGNAVLAKTSKSASSKPAQKTLDVMSKDAKYANHSVGVENVGGKIQLKVSDGNGQNVTKDVVGNKTVNNYVNKLDVNNSGKYTSDKLTKIDSKVKILPQDKLPSDMKNTFKDGAYKTVVTTEDIVMYRVYGNKAIKKGSYATTESMGNRINAKTGLALKPDWKNSMQYEAKILVPKGTHLNIGKAELQELKSGTILKGGNDQIILPKKWDENWIIETYPLPSK